MGILKKGTELLQKIPRQFYLPIGIACIGLILFGYGFTKIAGNTTTHENSSFYDFSQQQVSSSSAQTDMNQIVIDVEGAVMSPGVYHIATTSRVQDALVAAGGLSDTADRQWVSQHVNLASKVTDGTKVYIPTTGDVSQGMNTSASVAGASTIDSGFGNSDSGVIDINSASLDSLDSLPGIGQVTAQKIISGRPYASVQDLLNRKIVSAKVFEKIKDLIIVQ